MLKRGIKILAGILVVYVALVASHKGEFWPFSIYPMFSRGPHPWTSPIVRKLPADAGDIPWNSKSKNNMPGKAFALNKIGIDQNDLSAYLTTTKQWNNVKINGLRAYFKSKLDQNSFLIIEAHGQITNNGRDSVTVTYTPYILVRKDTTIFNPEVFSPSSSQTDL